MKTLAEYGRTSPGIVDTEHSSDREDTSMSAYFFKLLEFEVIPIVNENDTTRDELRFGDNDSLALVAGLLMRIYWCFSDGLIQETLSYPGARRIGVIREITLK